MKSVSSFQYYEGSTENQWFQVSLDEKDDIVTVYTDKWGDMRILFFRNSAGEGKQYEALRAENHQTENIPYFIRWKDKNYMAVPYWGMSNETDKIRGAAVWDFNDGGYWCVGIGINNDNTRNICYQIYNRGRTSSIAQDEIYGYVGGWPRVVEDASTFLETSLE